MEGDRKMAGLKQMNGRPVDMESERRFYKRCMEMQDIEMDGGHFLLVPAGVEVDGKEWELIHGETMTTCNEFTLDDGDTVEDLASHLRESMPGADVQPPMACGRIDVRSSNSGKK